MKNGLTLKRHYEYVRNTNVLIATVGFLADKARNAGRIQDSIDIRGTCSASSITECF